jgi:uncharacterized damage-inducible protein DinB
VGASPLEHVLRHNAWATTALGTLQHLVGAEQWYTKLLTGEVLGRPIRRTDPPHSLDELAAIATATGARLLDVSASDDPARVVVTNEPRRSTVGVVLAQVVHHGNEHRTQATTILGANGLQPPPLCAWAYGRAMRISTTEE